MFKFWLHFSPVWDAPNEGNGGTPSQESTAAPAEEASAPSDQISAGPDDDPNSSLLGDPVEPASEEGPDPFGEPLTIEGLQELVGEGELDESLSGEFLERLNAATSRTEVAKTMLEMQGKVMEAATAEITQNWDKLQSDWKKETRAHPEIGGDAYQESLATARKVIETYAEDATALKQILTITGAGNNVHMVQLLNAVAEHLPKEASPVEGAPAPTEKSRAERLFGNPTN